MALYTTRDLIIMQIAASPGAFSFRINRRFDLAAITEQLFLAVCKSHQTERERVGLAVAQEADIQLPAKSSKSWTRVCNRMRNN